MKKPYVITEDVEILMQKWASQRGFSLPSHRFFLMLQNRLLKYLKLIFKNVVMIRAEDLNQRLKEKIQLACHTTIVSIDQIYNSTQHHLESNRIADLNTSEIIGEAERPGYSSLREQIRRLPNDKPLTLVDDGCFSGETLRRIYELIREERFMVDKIIVGILIDRENNHLVKAHPEVSLEAVYEYKEAIDWVCERDFFIGVPLSGRTAGIKQLGKVIPCNPAVSLPYCLPFGDPVKGASIPKEKAVEFSKFCIKLSQRLWEEVERISKRKVLSQDIPRLPKGIERNKQRFVEALSRAMSKL